MHAKAMKACRGLIALSLVLTVAAVMTVGGAAADASPLDLGWGSEGFHGSEPEPAMPVRPGLEIQIQIPEVILSTNHGTLTCVGGSFPRDDGLRSIDQTNDRTTDKLEVTGVYGLLREGRLECTNGTELPSPALIGLESADSPQTLGTMSLGSKGKAKLKTSSRSDPAYVSIAFGANAAKCVFSLTSLKAALTAVPHGYRERLSLAFTKQKLKFAASLSTANCPNIAALEIPLATPFHLETSFNEFFIDETGLS